MLSMPWRQPRSTFMLVSVACQYAILTLHMPTASTCTLNTNLRKPISQSPEYCWPLFSRTLTKINNGTECGNQREAYLPEHRMRCCVILFCLYFQSYFSLLKLLQLWNQPYEKGRLHVHSWVRVITAILLWCKHMCQNGVKCFCNTVCWTARF